MALSIATRTTLRLALRTRAQARALSTSTSASAPAPAPAPFSWKPALAPGVQPAYDEALSYLAAHSAKLQQRIDGAGAGEEEALKIAAGINDPAVLAAFRAGTYDLAEPVYRHLREKAWRKYGALDKLMQRCTLMHVLPDVLDTITPTVDLQLAFGHGPGIGDHGGHGGDVLAGVFVHPRLSLSQPSVSATAFHTDERKYSLLTVDPDVPDEENMTFQTKLHLLITDVPVSATRPFDPQAGTTVQPYIPPHPAKGTPYHRYTSILLEQQPGSSIASPAPAPSESNAPFDVAAFIKSNNLTPAGIHFWRAKWDKDNADTISMIYRDILSTSCLLARLTRPAILTLPACLCYRDARAKVRPTATHGPCAS